MIDQGVMLILRGIKNLLHEQPALDYAAKFGFVGEVLDVSGEPYDNSPQVKETLRRIGEGGVTALYGFSGGGYNAVHIWDHLDQIHRDQIVRVVIVGSPGVKASHFQGVRDVIMFNAENVAHMEQPASLLETT